MKEIDEMGIEVIENGLIYNGKKICVKNKKNKYVIDADGKKIRVSSDQFVLLYAFFASMFKGECDKNGLKKEEEVYL